MLTHTREELQQVYRSIAGAAGSDPQVLIIDEYSPQLIVAGNDFDQSHARPDAGIISGPTLFSLVDSMGYLVTMSRSPKGSQGFTTGVAMQFLRPAPIGRLTIEGRSLRFSRRLSVVDTTIRASGVQEPVATAVVTYAPIFADS